jgi:hypothetical protein
MLAVFIMHVWMRMFHHFMLVLVANLGDMEPHARAHQRAGGNKLSRHRFA